jgi:hypothetical protein
MYELKNSSSVNISEFTGHKPVTQNPDRIFDGMKALGYARPVR